MFSLLRQRICTLPPRSLACIASFPNVNDSQGKYGLFAIIASSLIILNDPMNLPMKAKCMQAEEQQEQSKKEDHPFVAARKRKQEITRLKNLKRNQQLNEARLHNATIKRIKTAYVPSSPAKTRASTFDKFKSDDKYRLSTSSPISRFSLDFLVTTAVINNLDNDSDNESDEDTDKEVSETSTRYPSRNKTSSSVVKQKVSGISLDENVVLIRKDGTYGWPGHTFHRCRYENHFSSTACQDFVHWINTEGTNNNGEIYQVTTALSEIDSVRNVKEMKCIFFFFLNPPPLVFFSLFFCVFQTIAFLLGYS